MHLQRAVRFLLLAGVKMHRIFQGMTKQIEDTLSACNDDPPKRWAYCGTEMSQHKCDTGWMYCRASGQYLLNLHAWHQKLVTDGDAAQVSSDLTGTTAKAHEDPEAESGHDG